MPENTESFTLIDRRELIKQGLQLDQIVSDLGNMRILIKDDISEVNNGNSLLELRVRALEDFNIKIKTTLWLIGIFFTVLNTTVTILVQWLGQHK